MSELKDYDTLEWFDCKNNVPPMSIMKKNKIKLLPLRYEICGEDDRRYVFASPLTARVICMKCAKETK